MRANIEQLIGGAGEETIIARVGEGIVSAIGSCDKHLQVLENPDLISKTVLARKLDSQTAFEIVSIDIADVDVGANIGARLQADQAEAEIKRRVFNMDIDPVTVFHMVRLAETIGSHPAPRSRHPGKRAPATSPT